MEVHITVVTIVRKKFNTRNHLTKLSNDPGMNDRIGESGLVGENIM